MKRLGTPNIHSTHFQSENSVDNEEYACERYRILFWTDGCSIDSSDHAIGRSWRDYDDCVDVQGIGNHERCTLYL